MGPFLVHQVLGPNPPHLCSNEALGQGYLVGGGGGFRNLRSVGYAAQVAGLTHRPKRMRGPDPAAPLPPPRAHHSFPRVFAHGLGTSQSPGSGTPSCDHLDTGPSRAHTGFDRCRTCTPRPAGSAVARPNRVCSGAAPALSLCGMRVCVHTHGVCVCAETRGPRRTRGSPTMCAIAWTGAKRTPLKYPPPPVSSEQ